MRTTRDTVRGVLPRSSPTSRAAKVALAVGAFLALAATSSATPAQDVAVDLSAEAVSAAADVQVLTVARPATAGGKFAGAPRPPALPAAPAAAPADGPLGIPGIPFAAYRAAEARMATDQPGCGISWTVLAGIGYVESSHVHGGRVDAAGTVLEPVLGPVLDGSGAGDGVIPDTDGGVLDGNTSFDRAVGPTQFLPATWAAYGADGNGDGRADPQNVFDSSLGTARYLCSGGMDMRTSAHQQTAVYRYNHSQAYVSKVLMWAQAYASGSAPSSSTSSSSAGTSSSSGTGSSSGAGYSDGSSSGTGYSDGSSSGTGYSSGSGYSDGSGYSSGTGYSDGSGYSGYSGS